MNKKESKPWYRYPLVWMLVIIPFSSMVMGVVMLTNAIRSFDGLVEDDYYKKGKQINSRLERDDYASDHDMMAKLTLVDNLPVIKAEIIASDMTLPASIKVRFIHPTKSGFDADAQLLKQDDNKYLGTFESRLSPGKWLLRVESDEFRLQRSLVLPFSGDLVVNNQAAKQ